FLINSSANVFIAGSSSSSSTSRPLTMAPTGLITSWQTREQSSAARSRASSWKPAAIENPDSKNESARCETCGDLIARRGLDVKRSCGSSTWSHTRGTAVSNLYDDYAKLFCSIALEAGAAIMAIYAGDAQARLKADRSPVTDADERAEALILARLAAALPELP